MLLFNFLTGDDDAAGPEIFFFRWPPSFNILLNRYEQWNPRRAVQAFCIQLTLSLPPPLPIFLTCCGETVGFTKIREPFGQENRQWRPSSTKTKKLFCIQVSSLIIADPVNVNRLAQRAACSLGSSYTPIIRLKDSQMKEEFDLFCPFATIDPSKMFGKWPPPLHQWSLRMYPNR